MSADPAVSLSSTSAPDCPAGSDQTGPDQTESAPSGSPRETAVELPSAVEESAANFCRDDQTPATADTAEHENPGDDRLRVVFGRTLREGLARLGGSGEWHYPAPEPDGTSPLIVDWASDVTEDEISWLWPGRIPFGRLTLLAASEPRTASFVALDLAARLSRAAAWPGDAEAQSDSSPENLPADQNSREFCDGNTSPKSASADLAARVLYLAPHHERATHCIPGLRQAGAVMANVLCLDGVCCASEENSETTRGWRPLVLPDDMSSLRLALCELTDVQLLVLDPFEAFVDAAGSSKVRHRVADLLRELAWDFGIAVLAVTRLKPAAGGRRAVPEIENQALANKASAVWGVFQTGRQKRHHLLLPIHCALDKPGPALTFDLKTGPDAGQIQWNSNPFEMTAADFADDRNTGIKFAIAASWLKSLLARGPRSKDEIGQQARSLGISANMLRNVQKELRVKSRKSGYQAAAMWELPAELAGGRPTEIPTESPSGISEDLPVEDGEENTPEPLTVGRSPSPLDDFAGISNDEARRVPPHG